MARHLRYGLLFLALVFASVLGHAQGGSEYSALGVGDIRQWTGGMYDAMSGTSIGMPTPHGINTVNPSLLGITPTTRIQAGYRFNQSKISADGSSILQNNGYLDGLVAMFSVDTAMGFGMSLGLLPYSKVNYFVSRNLSTTVDGATVNGTSQQLGEGGVSQVQFGASVRLFNQLRLGVQVAGLFGVLTYTDDTQFEGIYSSVYSSQSYDVRGLMFKAGAYWELAGGAVGIGALFAGGGEASNYITRHARGVASGNAYFDTTEIETGNTPLPLQYGIGVSARIGDGRIGADLRLSDFNSMTVNVREDAGYTTSVRASLAYAHFGSQNPLTSFWKRIGWYAGAGYEQLYVTFQGKDVLEYNGSVGTSFPLGGQAMVDAGIYAGMRGPSGPDELSELFAKITVTVSIGETWFKPFVRD